MMAPDGIDPSMALNLVESDGLGESAPQDFKKLLEATRPEVLVECIPQNIRSGEPSLGFLRMALDMGIHAVTSNKAPIVLGYRDLRHRAAKSGVTFRFESTVLDGLPLFLFVSQLREVKVTRVRGVLNATSSVVLESVQLGSTRSRGLARAQAQGIAEADSVLDLDGWDAAAKVALLANVWMGGALRVVDVARTGCDAVKDEVIRAAGEAGGHFRLVGEARKGEDGSIKANVDPVTIEPGDPLYPLKGSAGGILVETDAGHSFTLLQQTSGIDDAAFGLIQDCRAILAGLPQV
jgi:homoserine dehydrogenase